MNESMFEPVLVPLIVGDEVPTDVTFEVYHKDDIFDMSFNDLRGKWSIIFFYPADFTFVCPTELGEMSALYKEFQEVGAEIVSVSTDTAFAHKAWHDSSESIKKIEYPMAADPSHDLADLFGVLIEEKGMARRGTFIISPEGIIKSIEINDNAIGRCAKETMRKLKAAIYVGENPSNVCPASWNEGDDTITPAVDLVGKI